MFPFYWTIDPPAVRCYYFRACAEEALQRLHQTVIGTQAVRLSWGRSPGNKQTTDVSRSLVVLQLVIGSVF